MVSWHIYLVSRVLVSCVSWIPRVSRFNWTRPHLLRCAAGTMVNTSTYAWFSVGLNEKKLIWCQLELGNNLPTFWLNAPSLSPWWWLEHSVETSVSYFPSSSWYQITFSSFMQKPTEKPLKYQTSLATLCGWDYPMVNTNQVNLTESSVGSKKVICYQLEFGKCLLIFD